MARQLTRPAVFLDRDGTINVDKHYVHRVEDLELIEGAPAAIRRLNEAGFLVIVVTNQSGVARGFFSEADVEALHAHMSAELDACGAHIDRFYYCPHHADDGIGEYRRASSWRKPDIGMFEQARRDFAIDVDRSWMVGDKAEDVEFARRAGLKALRVVPEHGGQTVGPDGSAATCTSIVDAVDHILRAIRR